MYANKTSRRDVFTATMSHMCCNLAHKHRHNICGRSKSAKRYAFEESPWPVGIVGTNDVKNILSLAADGRTHFPEDIVSAS